MSKYKGRLTAAGLFLLGGVASATLVTPVISNGGFEAGGQDWRLYNANFGQNTDAVEGTYSLDFNNVGYDIHNPDSLLDRDSTRIPLNSGDETEFSFSAKNLDGSQPGNRIGFHVVEFDDAGTLTAADAVYYFDTGAPGSWSTNQVSYAVRAEGTTKVNIAFRFYHTDDGVNFSGPVEGHYLIDDVKTIPEPATLSLMALLGGALVVIRRNLG